MEAAFCLNQCVFTCIIHSLALQIALKVAQFSGCCTCSYFDVLFNLFSNIASLHINYIEVVFKTSFKYLWF